MNTIIARVTDLNYITNDEQTEPIVRLSARGIEGANYEKEIYGTEPYLFVPEDETVPSTGKIKRVENDYGSYDNQEIKKIVTQIPDQVSDIRELFDVTYEADVPFTRRVSVDEGLSGYIEIPEIKDKIHIDDVKTEVEDLGEDGITPRVMMADIETEPPENSNDWETYVDKAPGKVLMLTTYDSYDDEYLCLALDEEREIDPESVRNHLEDHWEGHDNSEFYTSCDIRFNRFEKEEILLRAFLDEVDDKRPDIISGWNFVDFDWKYLLNRINRDEFKHLNYHRLSTLGFIKPWLDEKAVPGLPAFDMMSSYCDQMSYGDWRSKSLDYVSGEELDAGKVEGDSIMKEYNNRRSKFMAYNLIDVQLCVGLDKKHGIHEFFYQLGDVCGCQISDTHSEMRLVESFLFTHRTDQEILPTTEEIEMDDATGGLVLQPSNGISDWVGVLDLKSLYPSTIISMNVSQETITNTDYGDVVCPNMPLNDENVPGSHITADDIDWDNGTGLSFENQGLISKYIGLLFKERDKYKEIRDGFNPDNSQYEAFDNKQRGIKVVMNSFFGVSDNKYFRLSTEGMGDVITGASRYVTWKGVQIAKDMGYSVDYGDTDSAFISLADNDEDVTEEEVIERGKELEEELNARMTEVADDFGIPEEHPYLSDDLHGTEQHTWVWELEKVARRFLQTGSKKRYSLLPIWEEGKYLDTPDPSITGYEAVRSSSPNVTTTFQTEMLRRILQDQDFEQISDYVKTFADELEKGEKSIREYGIPGVLNKAPKDYPNRPTPRACMYSNEWLGSTWQEGDNPWVVYIKDTPHSLPDTEEIAVKWSDTSVPEGFKVDYKRHIDKHLSQPMDSILELTNWSFSELRTGKKTQSAFESSGDSSNPFMSGSSDGPSDPFSD